jgi:hypothetical protein
LLPARATQKSFQKVAKVGANWFQKDKEIMRREAAA